MSNRGGISRYEEERLQRIKENDKLIKELFPEGTKMLKPAVSQQTRRRPLTPEDDDNSDDSLSNHSRRKLLYNRHKYPTRHSTNSNYYDGPITRSMRNKSTNNTELENGLKDDQDVRRIVYTKKRRIVIDEEDPLIELDGLPACDQRLLKNVIYNTKRKVYDRYNGTTCHQCRQKTKDQKTICHNKNCNGTRGQFCGPCLKNRYGEDVCESLQNPEWVCPPCRGKCNCSFCLPKKGRPPTGIMIHIAKEAGFDSVQEYLER